MIQHLVVPEPQHLKALLHKPLIPPAIISLLFLMLAAINFNDQAALQTNKINDVGTNGHLATESNTGDLPLAQMLPETPFGVSHVGAKISGSFGRI
jgi:hypothetical protein